MISAYDSIVDLRSWVREEYRNGNRAKASRIYKVAERWMIRKYGINSGEWRRWEVKP
jgi:hypothetical protein